MSLLFFLPQGPLGVAVTYGGDHIPKSPFNVAVAPTVDLSKINVTGLGDSTYFPVIALVGCVLHTRAEWQFCCSVFFSFFFILSEMQTVKCISFLLITFVLSVWRPMAARKRKKIDGKL